MRFGQSDALLGPVRDLVARARHGVDIAALQPGPDTRFLAALRSGLAVLAVNGLADGAHVVAGSGGAGEQLERCGRRALRAVFLPHPASAPLLADVLAQELPRPGVEQAHVEAVPLDVRPR